MEIPREKENGKGTKRAGVKWKRPLVISQSPEGGEVRIAQKCAPSSIRATTGKMGGVISTFPILPPCLFIFHFSFPRDFQCSLYLHFHFRFPETPAEGQEVPTIEIFRLNAIQTKGIISLFLYRVRPTGAGRCSEN